jgi:putative FmdB family regulatory protein
MPIYEFQCKKCGAQVEVFQKLNDKHPVKCKQCGGRLEKLISAPAIQFKGSGWYVTDYAQNGKKAAEKAEKETAGSSSGDDNNSDKSEKKTKESSPAKKTSEKTSPSKVSKGD